MLLEELPAFVAGDVTRAASLPSAIKRIDWKLWSTREGVGETSGQPVGSDNGSLTRPINDPAEGWFGNEAFFIRCGDRVSTVTGGTAAVDFDPDVFADALDFFARRLPDVPRPAFPAPLTCHRCRRAELPRDTGRSITHERLALRRWLSFCQAPR